MKSETDEKILKLLFFPIIINNRDTRYEFWASLTSLKLIIPYSFLILIIIIIIIFRIIRCWPRFTHVRIHDIIIYIHCLLPFFHIILDSVLNIFIYFVFKYVIEYFISYIYIYIYIYIYDISYRCMYTNFIRHVFEFNIYLVLYTSILSSNVFNVTLIFIYAFCFVSSSLSQHFDRFIFPD